jgi:hypothetical protein
MESLNLLIIIGILGVFQLCFQPFSGFPTLMTRYLRSVRVSQSTGKFTPMKEQHEVAKLLNELVREDGAGSWPPLVNHTLSDWPEPLRTYRHIYLELATLLPQETPSLDNRVNTARVAEFRRRFWILLGDRVDLTEVEEVRICAVTDVKIVF